MVRALIISLEVQIVSPCGAQLVERLTLDLRQVVISRFANSGPTSGSALTARSLETALDSVSPSSLCPSPAHSLSRPLSKKKKKICQKK